MASCEYCWERSFRGDYGQTIRRAEAEGWPCTKNDANGARLRAGQFWDEVTQTDTRLATAPSQRAVESPAPTPEK